MYDFIEDDKYCGNCEIETENIYIMPKAHQYSKITCPICKRVKERQNKKFRMLCNQRKIVFGHNQDTLADLYRKEQRIRWGFKPTSPYKCPYCGFVHYAEDQPLLCPCCRMPYKTTGTEKREFCKMIADAVPTQKLYDEKGIQACPRCASTDFYEEMKKTIFGKVKYTGSHICRKCNKLSCPLRGRQTL